MTLSCPKKRLKPYSAADDGSITRMIKIIHQMHLTLKGIGSKHLTFNLEQKEGSLSNPLKRGYTMNEMLENHTGALLK